MSDGGPRLGGKAAGRTGGGIEEAERLRPCGLSPAAARRSWAEIGERGVGLRAVGR